MRKLLLSVLTLFTLQPCLAQLTDTELVALIKKAEMRLCGSVSPDAVVWNLYSREHDFELSGPRVVVVGFGGVDE